MTAQSSTSCDGTLERYPTAMSVHGWQSFVER